MLSRIPTDKLYATFSHYHQTAERDRMPTDRQLLQSYRALGRPKPLSPEEREAKDSGWEIHRRAQKEKELYAKYPGLEQIHSHPDYPRGMVCNTVLTEDQKKLVAEEYRLMQHHLVPKLLSHEQLASMYRSFYAHLKGGYYAEKSH